MTVRRAGPVLRLTLAGLLALGLPAVHAAAQDEMPEAGQALIHSDLPLWTPAQDHFYPRNFSDGDSFGCMSRVPFGDWKFEANTEVFGDAVAEANWWHLGNYGVFHCALVERRSDERGEQDASGFRHAWIAQMDTITINRRTYELWDLQSGSRPGSDHTLLMREADKDKVSKFTVLQRVCPAALQRNTAELDIWLTSYCAVNSRRDLAALARRMARLAPLGTITLQPGEAAADEK